MSNNTNNTNEVKGAVNTETVKASTLEERDFFKTDIIFKAKGFKMDGGFEENYETGEMEWVNYDSAFQIQTNYIDDNTGDMIRMTLKVNLPLNEEQVKSKFIGKTLKFENVEVHTFEDGRVAYGVNEDTKITLVKDSQLSFKLNTYRTGTVTYVHEEKIPEFDKKAKKQVIKKTGNVKVYFEEINEYGNMSQLTFIIEKLPLRKAETMIGKKVIISNIQRRKNRQGTYYTTRSIELV